MIIKNVFKLEIMRNAKNSQSRSKSATQRCILMSICEINFDTVGSTNSLGRREEKFTTKEQVRDTKLVLIFFPVFSFSFSNPNSSRFDSYSQFFHKQL